MYAFKSVVTALIIMTTFLIGTAFIKTKDNNTRALIVYFMGIYLLSGVAIWI